MDDHNSEEVSGARKFPIGCVLALAVIATPTLVFLIGAFRGPAASSVYLVRSDDFGFGSEGASNAGEIRRIAGAFASELRASGFRWDGSRRLHSKNLREGVVVTFLMVENELDLQVEFDATCSGDPSEGSVQQARIDACFKRWKRRFAELREEE